MTSLHPAKSMYGRAIALSLAIVIAVSATAEGVLALGREVGIRLTGTAAAPHYTEAPYEAKLGDKPSRDSKRSAWWTPRLSADLRNHKIAETVVGGDLLASIDLMAQWQRDDKFTEDDKESGGRISVEGAFLIDEGQSLTPTNQADLVHYLADSQGPTSSEGGSTVNTNTGNRLTPVNIVSWDTRGSMRLEFTLFHNSISSYQSAFGQSWSHTYDARITHTPGSSAILRLGDGISIPYLEENGQFLAPIGVFDSLVRNVNGTWTWTKRNFWRYEFNAGGHLIQVRDRTNNTITILRDGQNRITQINDASGRSLGFSYDGSNRVSRVTDPTGRFWTFTYNSSNQLTQIGYPTLDGQTFRTQFTYDSLHNILTETDRRNNVWRWSYDSSERLASSTNPLNQSTTYTYATGSTTIRKPGGQTTVHNYSQGMLVSKVDPAGFSQNFTWSTARTMATRTDERGGVWRLTHDANGNITSATNPLNQAWAFTYNATNDLLTATDQAGHISRYFYDGQGNMTESRDALNRIIESRTYDSHGQILTTADGLGRMDKFAYDTHGNAVEITYAAKAPMIYTFDPVSVMTSANDGGGNVTLFTHDAWSRLVSIAHPDKTTEGRTWDPEGNLVETIDGLGYRWTTEYDAANRPIKVTNPRGDTEVRAYNSNGWLTSVTNGRGFTRTYTYTPRGERATQTLPDGAVTSWSYNGTGQVSAMTIATGQQIRYEYDLAGRQLREDLPTGTDPVWTYDAAGRRTSMTDATGVTSWTYNAAGDLTRLVTPAGTIDYTYNAAAEMTSMTQSGVGTTTYAYLPNGRVDRITNPFGEVTRYEYDALGRLSRKTFGNGQTETFTYDERSRAVGNILRNSGGQIQRSRSFGFDAAGRVVSSVTNSQITSFAYDPLGQLVSETRPGYSASYTYDGNGNRLSRTVNGNLDTYTYDAGDKLLRVQSRNGTVDYTYDAAGRPTAITGPGGTQNLAWDVNSRLTQVTYPGAATNTFAYNGFGARVNKSDSLGSKAYLRDGARVTDPVLREGSTSFTPGVSERRGGVTHFNHAGLKSFETQSLTNQSIVASRTYDAFGNLSSTSGTWSGPFGHGGPAGYQSDPDSGWQLLGHRYYDPNLGRFLTRDPVQDGSNWYIYAYNNPVGQIDDDGLTPKLLLIPLAWKGAKWLGKQIAEEVVYEFIDRQTGKPYVGQTGRDLCERLEEHERDGRIKKGDDVKYTVVPGGKTVRECAEQATIDKHGGKENTSNDRNPIGPRRRKLWQWVIDFFSA